MNIFVYSVIPPDSEDLIAKYGLLSAAEVVKRPDVLKRARLDKASRADFRKRVKTAIKSPYPYRMLGPSTLFSLPDPAKITDKHFIKEWGLVPVRINLSQLLQDFPEAYVWGAELLPFNREWYNMSDEEVDADIASMGFASWEDYLRARSHELSDAEIEAYSIMTPQELWEHYDVADAGKKYASNVPHAFIITPSGAIPPQYIDFLNDVKVRDNPLLMRKEGYIVPDSRSPLWFHGACREDASLPRKFQSYGGELAYYDAMFFTPSERLATSFARNCLEDGSFELGVVYACRIKDVKLFDVGDLFLNLDDPESPLTSEGRSFLHQLHKYTEHAEALLRELQYPEWWLFCKYENHRYAEDILGAMEALGYRGWVEFERGFKNVAILHANEDVEVVSVKVLDEHS